MSLDSGPQGAAPELSLAERQMESFFKLVVLPKKKLLDEEEVATRVTPSKRKRNLRKPTTGSSDSERSEMHGGDGLDDARADDVDDGDQSPQGTAHDQVLLIDPQPRRALAHLVTMGVATLANIAIMITTILAASKYFTEGRSLYFPLQRAEVLFVPVTAVTIVVVCLSLIGVITSVFTQIQSRRIRNSIRPLFFIYLGLMCLYLAAAIPTFFVFVRVREGKYDEELQRAWVSQCKLDGNEICAVEEYNKCVGWEKKCTTKSTIDDGCVMCSDAPSDVSTCYDTFKTRMSYLTTYLVGGFFVVLVVETICLLWVWNLGAKRRSPT